MRYIKFALCALVIVMPQIASAREANLDQVFGDSAISSVMAQRTFAGVLPSIADYSQTAHSVLKDGEYCPVDSLTGASYCQPGAKWVMWDTPFMQFDARDWQGDYAGLDTDMNGFGTGIGRMVNDNTVVGLAVGWDARETDLDEFVNILDDDWNISSKDRSDAFHAAIYGGISIGYFFMDAYAGYSQTWHRTRLDSIGVGNQFDKETANYDDAVYSAGVKASYIWILPNELRFISSIGLDYSHLSRDREKVKYYQDGIRVVDSVLGKTTFNSFQTPVNFALNKTFQSDILTFGGKPSWWTPEVRAGFVPQFGRKRVSSTFVEGANINIYKSSKYDSYGTVGAGVKIKLRDKYIFAVDYDYRFGRDYGSHLVTGTYGVSF